MIKLKNWLNKHNIKYGISYDNINKNIKNIKVGEYAIYKDSGIYTIYHIVTKKFEWAIFDEVINKLMQYENLNKKSRADLVMELHQIYTNQRLTDEEVLEQIKLVLNREIMYFNPYNNN